MTKFIKAVDRWVVLKLTNTDGGIHYRLFMGWYGGYTGGDAWQMNSGIVKVNMNDKLYEFHGFSGSIYQAHPSGYGMSGLMHSILATYTDAAKKAGGNIEVMPAEIDWVNMVYP